MTEQRAPPSLVPVPGRREPVVRATRLVVKVGTRVLTHDDGELALRRFHGVVEVLGHQRRTGRDVLLVSSGAVGLGQAPLGLSEPPSDLAQRQACAAVGQGRLMELYHRGFERMGIPVAQLLVTRDDFSNPKRRANLQATVRELLRRGVVPIVNENDVVSTEELAEGPGGFGDNDQLSALLARAVQAQLLVLCTDVAGVFDRPPTDPEAVLLDRADGPQRARLVFGPASAGRRGRGGMQSKLAAAALAAEAGCEALILSGIDPDALQAGLEGQAAGTWVPAERTPEAEPAEEVPAEGEPGPSDPKPTVRTDEGSADAAISSAGSPSADTPLAPTDAAGLLTTLRAAQRRLGAAPDLQRRALMQTLAARLRHSEPEIRAANEADRAAAQELAPPLKRRLGLGEAKLAALGAGLSALAEAPDPLNRIVRRTRLDVGLELEQVTAPLGVLLVIYESRPDATVQIGSLALRSGNGLVLKGGAEAFRTNRVLVEILRRSLEDNDLDPDAVVMLSDRAAVWRMLEAGDGIDLVIPRGSASLVRAVQERSRAPVLGHADGRCHTYLDAAADPDKAGRIVFDGKCDAPSACNATETLLVHQDFWPRLGPVLDRLRAAGVELRIDPGPEPLPDGAIRAADDGSDWKTEHGDLILGVRWVPSMEAAIAHIHAHGSSHTECIVTEDQTAAESFLGRVDAACVFHDASTRFADGYRFGLGAEVGISTSRIHARGPVGLEGLLTTRWLLRGRGQVAADYGPTGRPFLHEARPIDGPG
jgi:delta-1-pyrroline-5-carboxylate synthetase